MPKESHRARGYTQWNITPVSLDGRYPTYSEIVVSWSRKPLPHSRLDTTQYIDIRFYTKDENRQTGEIDGNGFRIYRPDTPMPVDMVLENFRTQQQTLDVEHPDSLEYNRWIVNGRGPGRKRVREISFVNHLSTDALTEAMESIIEIPPGTHSPGLEELLTGFEPKLICEERRGMGLYVNGEEIFTLTPDKPRAIEALFDEDCAQMTSDDD